MYYIYVATALTVYGIETEVVFPYDALYVATALTVYGIETATISAWRFTSHQVATALTVYGIETFS